MNGLMLVDGSGVFFLSVCSDYEDCSGIGVLLRRLSVCIGHIVAKLPLLQRAAMGVSSIFAVIVRIHNYSNDATLSIFGS
jgi:hypothetical protein